MKKEDERAELFLSFPSALVAYSLRAIILAIVVWSVGDLYRQATLAELIVVHDSINWVIKFIVGVVPGVLIGRLFSAFHDVISLAKRKQRSLKAGG